MWLHLTPKPATEQRDGQLRVSLTFREEKVLPDVGYEELLETVLSENLAIPTLLGQIASNVPEKKEIFRNLMGILELKGKGVAIVTALIRKEIENTKDLTVLFRGNSIATVALDVFMQVVGGHLLSQTLRETVQKIFLSKQAFEIDPDRADDLPGGPAKFDAAKNLAALLEALNEVWAKIQENANLVPPNLRQVLGSIRFKVKEKWPTEDTAHYTCVTAFLFLRFFSAAILGPQLFGLIDRTCCPRVAIVLFSCSKYFFPENPGALCLRNLTLVSKILMNLANLVLFGKKEPHMKPVNDWVEANLLKMRKYVDAVAKPTTDRSINSGPGLVVNFGQNMSFIHRYLAVKRPAILGAIEAAVSRAPTPEDSEDSEASLSFIDPDSSDDENMMGLTYSGSRASSPRFDETTGMYSTHTGSPLVRQKSTDLLSTSGSSPDSTTKLPPPLTDPTEFMMASWTPPFARTRSTDSVRPAASAPDMSATLPPPLTRSGDLSAPLPPPLAGSSSDSIALNSSASLPITIPPTRPLTRTPSGGPRPEKSPLVSIRVREARSSSVLRRRSAKEMAKNLLKEVDEATIVRNAVAATLGSAAPIRRSSGSFVSLDVYVPALRHLLQVLEQLDVKTGEPAASASSSTPASAIPASLTSPRPRSPSVIVYTK